MEIATLPQFCGFIYIVTNKITDIKYIGQTTVPINKRWYFHVWDSVNNRKTGSYLHKAIAKYGKENFVIDCMENVVEDSQDSLIRKLNEKEIEYIKLYNTKAPNGYNLTDGGGGSSGFAMPTSVREKISKANKGKNSWSKDFRHSDSQKLKWSNERSGSCNPFHNKTHSEKTKQKLSKSIKSYFSNNLTTQILLETYDTKRKNSNRLDRMVKYQCSNCSEIKITKENRFRTIMFCRHCRGKGV